MNAIEKRARELLDAEMGEDPRETYYAAVAVISRLLALQQQLDRTEKQS